MPYINIRTAGEPLTGEQIRRLATKTTEHMTKIMGKKGALTSVRIEPTDPLLWAVGGDQITEGGGRAAHIYQSHGWHELRRGKGGNGGSRPQASSRCFGSTA